MNAGNDALVAQLAADWLDAKRAEQLAAARRLEIEKKICMVVPPKPEGSTSLQLQNGLKLRTTGKLSYKADIEQLKALCSSWPEEIRPIRAKLEADEPLLRAIRTDRPDLWRVLAPAITLQPAKTYIVVEANT